MTNKNQTSEYDRMLEQTKSMCHVQWEDIDRKDTFFIGAHYVLKIKGGTYDLGQFDMETDGCGFFHGNQQIYHLGDNCMIEKYAFISQERSLEDKMKDLETLAKIRKRPDHGK